MKLTMKTEKLKEMLTRSVKGAGNNKLIPLTSLLAIQVEDSTLTLITTDATNYLYVGEYVANEDFSAVVDVNMFSKLISKMTCENVILEVNNGILTVKGNGTYKLELPLDENGDAIKYPDPVDKLDASSANRATIHRSVIRAILDTVKPALATTLENPCYTGYYVGDNQIVATDTYKIASMNVDLLGTTTLLSPEFLELLDVNNDETMDVDIVDDTIVCTSSDCIVYGKVMSGIEDYAITAISELVNTDFESSCVVPKLKLLQLLDRLSLFVGRYDKNAVHLTFTKDGLQVSSKSANGIELIDYISSENFLDFTCAVDIEMLTQEVKSISGDTVKLFYGRDNAIKIVDGNITIIVALLEDSMDD